MIWLTSLLVAVLIIGGLAAALLFAAGARLALRALIRLKSGRCCILTGVGAPRR